LNIIVFGAHPDDCEVTAAGTAVKLVRNGHKVKFVSLTNGDKGHMSLNSAELAQTRFKEAERAAAVLGVEFDVLDNHDCYLSPAVEVRERLVGLIRQWQADMVMCHRPNDYHPDHRNTGLLIQDTAYLVMVPLFCPGIPPLRKNPIYMYLMDRFISPEPFQPDVIVPIDDVYDKKIEALHQMSSQFYEWLPWIDGTLAEVPDAADEAGRKECLKSFVGSHFPEFREQIVNQYGAEAAKTIEQIEAFQLCEYGSQPSLEELHGMFPELPARVDLSRG
jgi:LmbE family N-acetylglucosaminyl deacetylase